MKLNEKQLTIIFVVLFALILLGSYFFTQTVPPPAPSEITHAVRALPPLSEEEKVLAEKVLSGELTPLSKEESVMAQQVLSSKSPKPLSASEQAAAKKILGN